MDIIQSNYDVYAKYVSMFMTYKVTELREIAQRMNIAGRSTMKKGDLAHVIALAVLAWSDEAFSEIAVPVQETFTIPGTDVTLTDPKSVELMKAHYARLLRYNPTMRRNKNGDVILTPAQKRRVHKKMHVHAKKIGFYPAA